MNNISSSNSQKALVPELRFPEFTEKWKSTKFADLFEFLSNNTLSRADLSDSGTVKNIHYGDVLVKFGDVVSAKDNTIPFVKYKTQLGKNTDYLKNGDIIIADTAEDDTVGKATEIQNISNESVVSGLHTIPCRAKESFAGGFLGYYLNSSAYRSQLYPLMQGIKVTSISKGNISKTELKFPSVNEQEKIAGMLSLIDKKIEAQRQIIDSLKLYKRGALQQIFSNNHNCKPLKEITSYVSSSLALSSLKDEPLGAYPVYDASGISQYIDSFQIENKYIAIIKDGSGVGKLRLCKSQSSIIGTLGAIVSKGLPIEYIYAFMQTVDFKQFVTGMAIPHIYYKDYSEIKVPIPDVATINKIVNIFNGIDLMIIAEENKYNYMMGLKQGLLQKMFI